MILITGAAGYIGSHCALRFLKQGEELVVFDNLENGHQEIIDSLQRQGKVHFVQGDLREFEAINRVFDLYSIETVIHFAAFTLVGESVENPAKYYRNNTFGTLNLLDAMVAHQVNRIVFSSTCATYGELQYVPLDEKHPQNPINPYGASKLMVERILSDYDCAYGLKSIKLRYFNVIGADIDGRVGEWHEPETHLLPNVLKSTFGSGQIFTLFGDDYDTADGTCVRDYVNVEDLADAHWLAYQYLLREQQSDVFNLGTEQGNSVREIFKICEKFLRQEIPLQVAGRRPGDPDKLYADSNKAKQILKWHPQRSLEESVKTAYEWEKKLQELLMTKK